jgi:hypothetical protein
LQLYRNPERECESSALDTAGRSRRLQPLTVPPLRTQTHRQCKRIVSLHR